MKYFLQNKNSDYYKVVDNIIKTKSKIIFDFFNSEEIEIPFNIYIYDSIKDLVSGLRSRGYTGDPDYMCACHKDEDNSLNFFEPKGNLGEFEWLRYEYDKIIFHELIHGIQYTLFGTTPEWINEGIAKYLDGMFDLNYILVNYINNKPIPEQYEIENEFGEHKEYESYHYAYIMICYYIEVYGKDKLIEGLKDISKLNKDNLLIDSINYYNNIYGLNKVR